MTQEDRLLLIKDLSARLPYDVLIEHTKSGIRSFLHELKVFPMYDDNDNIFDCVGHTDFFGDNNIYKISEFKPYLFPLSSMTKEQRYELYGLIHNLNALAIDREIGDWIVSSSEIDWYNKNHFDYRGLIEKGLAINATGLNIY